MPHLVAWKVDVQGAAGILPRAAVTLTVMTQMPGVNAWDLRFWSLEKKDLELDSDVMKECMCYTSVCLTQISNTILVYRVNWLREKHRLDRWQEELALVKTDMQCAVSWYSHQMCRWQALADQAEEKCSLGHKAYAYKQKGIWEQLKERMEKEMSVCMAGHGSE